MVREWSENGQSILWPITELGPLRLKFEIFNKLQGCQKKKSGKPRKFCIVLFILIKNVNYFEVRETNVLTANTIAEKKEYFYNIWKISQRC